MRWIMKIIKQFRANGITHSLRAQLIIFFTIFSFFLLAIGVYFSYSYTMNVVKKQKQKESDLLQHFIQSDYKISSMVDDANSLFNLFLEDGNIERFLQTNSFGQSFEDVELRGSILQRMDACIRNNRFLSSIYFFTAGIGEIGRNAKYSFISRIDEQDIRFFDSAFFNDLNGSYPRRIWAGGYDELFFNPLSTNYNNPLVSIGKEVRSSFLNSGKSILVFNISERYMASLYAGLPEAVNALMYITDSGGRIISSSDGKNIGNISSALPYIQNAGTQNDNNSFSSNIVKNSLEIVTYKIRDTDWYMVGEIPLKLFSADVEAFRRFLLIISPLSVLVILAFSFLWLRKITEPLNVLAEKMQDMGSGKLGLTFPKVPKNEFGLVVGRFNEMSLSIADLMKKNEEIHEEKRKAEIEALQSQINPHFIYNTLNMIKWMAVMSKQKNIVESIVSLGNLLRPAFKGMDKMCELSVEIDYIDNYLKIMNWRFGHGISMELAIPEKYNSCRVPRFILQPVVENSIIHGMRKPENSIGIRIEAYEEHNELLVSITDNGTGMSEERLIEINGHLANTGKEYNSRGDGSIGLFNVNRRICLNFGERYGIRLESRENEGTRALIRLPVIE